MTGKQLGGHRKKYERRNGAVRQHFPGKGLGEFDCNICYKKYTRYGKYDRFCNSCRLRIFTPT
jgi:hypothetical protein